jgi:hypothetical protein
MTEHKTSGRYLKESDSLTHSDLISCNFPFVHLPLLRRSNARIKSPNVAAAAAKPKPMRQETFVLAEDRMGVGISVAATPGDSPIGVGVCSAAVEVAVIGATLEVGIAGASVAATAGVVGVIAPDGPGEVFVTVVPGLDLGLLLVTLALGGSGTSVDVTVPEGG